jgi:hypothetical protein
MPIQPGTIAIGTRANLIAGLRAKPMTEDAVDAVFRQVEPFAAQLVDTYTREIAAGEVGVAGSAEASMDAILAPQPPRELLYGRIQSGKTVAMILTSALCLDNGFRIVVVLTTDSVALVQQTASRFKALEGPRVLTAIKDGATYEWEGQEEQLREAIAIDGLVLVCAKNAFNLPSLLRFLQQVDASNYPVLLMDDEADAATPDTTRAARSSGRPNAPAYGSTMYRLVIQNDHPDEEGLSLTELFPHSLYLQVTATPYVLLLQRNEGSVHPTQPFLLEPGNGYCGGDLFFGDFGDEDPGVQRCVVVVGANELAVINRRVPEGLARSVDFFIVSACARALTDGRWPDEGFKHLSHTSMRTNDHDIVANHINQHLNSLRTDVHRSGDLEGYFGEAYAELQRTVDNCPPLAQIVPSVISALRQAQVSRINSKADVPQYGPRVNFLVGGNILGRGLTIDDLLVTYYIREAKVSQMDTVWQHARMFGYRRAYIDYVRVYLPERLAVRFRELHESEESLRDVIRHGRQIRALPIALPTGARATRPNALEADVPRVIPAGRAQTAPRYAMPDPTAALDILNILRENGVPVDERERERRARRVTLEVAEALVRGIPTPDDGSLWNEDVVVALLTSYEGVRDNGCLVYVRKLDATQDGTVQRTRGRLAGREVDIIRDAAGKNPALALLYSGDLSAPQYWFPTLILPEDSPPYIFNAE